MPFYFYKDGLLSSDSLTGALSPGDIAMFPLVVGGVSTAADFDWGTSGSSTSRISIDYSAGLKSMTEWTFSAWVDVPAANVYGVLFDNRGTNNEGWMIAVNPDKEFRFTVGTGSGTITGGTGTATLPAGWNYLTATHDGTSIRLYINGVLAHTQAAAFVSGTANPSAIGANRLTDTSAWGSSISEVTIFDKALTVGEIGNLYGASFSLQPGVFELAVDLLEPFSWWRLNEESGTSGAESVIDHSGGNRHGTPTNVTFGVAGALLASDVPDNFLVCDGSEVSRDDYSALFSEFGIVNGAGNGTTTFNLPDFARRSPRGAVTGDPAADNPVGSTGGAETHVHTIPGHVHQMEDQHRHVMDFSSHVHNMTHTHPSVSHRHSGGTYDLRTAQQPYHNNTVHGSTQQVSAGTGHRHGNTVAGNSGLSGFTVNSYTGNTGAPWSGSTNGHTDYVAGSLGAPSSAVISSEESHVPPFVVWAFLVRAV